MSHARILEFLLSSEWMLTREKMEVIRSVVLGETSPDPEAIQKEFGRPLQDAPEVRERDGVAVVPLVGPLFRRANLFTRISGATSTEEFATHFGAALRNPTVRQIIVHVDSPGGEVNGVSETAQLIRSARGEKPVTSFVSGFGASGAYWITTAAERVVVADTAILGSIGAVLALRRRNDDDEIVLVSSQSPKKRIDPETEEGQAEIQALLDSLADVFIDAVAENMGVARETVLSDFGQGSVLVGEAAVAAGMAHGVGTLEGLITELNRGARPGSFNGPAGTPGRATTQAGDNIMPEEAKSPAAPAVDRAYLDAHHPKIVASIQAEAATAERDRILGIQDLGGPEALVRECQEDAECGVGDAAIRFRREEQAQAEARKKAHLEERSKAEEDVETPPPSSESGSSDREKTVHKILANAGRLPAAAAS